MNTERDKFLTEQMGECWHEWEQVYNEGGSKCKTCGKYWPLPPDEETRKVIQGCNFSTREGFGKMWEWAKGHEWWATFTGPLYGPKVNNSALPIFNDVDYAINPDRFADAVYEFLKR